MNEAKYVAFIDTLGFKKRIQSIPHKEAVEVIRLFNQSVYNLWQEMGLDVDNKMHGRTFSDSFVINSQGDSNEELKNIIGFLIRLYRNSITKSDLPLRGGLSIGNFEDLRSIEFKNLQKGLIVGTAFIDAYLLESSNDIKGSKLLLDKKIYEKIKAQYKVKEVKKDKKNNIIYELIWGNIDFLTENDYEALNKLIELGSKSKWLDHYYGTLETFLVTESDKDKDEIYSKIIETLNKEYKYTYLDNFIENYLKSESAIYTKRSFLRYIRERIL